jgi:polyphenol oxidase
VPTLIGKKLIRKKTTLTILRGSSLETLPWLVHGFSTRVGGTSAAFGGGALNLGFGKHDANSAVQRNRETFLHKLGVGGKSPWPLITLRQIHSDIIHLMTAPPAHPLTGDGLLTATPHLLVAIQTADCLPVIIADPRQRAVGVFHAGWRGTVKRIVEKGVGEMLRCFGSRARDLRAAIGPGVHECCYEVGLEVREQFESQFAYAGKLFRELKDSDPVREKYPLLFLTARAPGHSDLPIKIFLDLAEANRRQLLDAGVLARNISTSEFCTSCRTDLLFSYRKERGVTGRMLAVAGIEEPIGRSGAKSR